MSIIKAFLTCINVFLTCINVFFVLQNWTLASPKGSRTLKSRREKIALLSAFCPTKALMTSTGHWTGEKWKVRGDLKPPMQVGNTHWISKMSLLVTLGKSSSLPVVSPPRLPWLWKVTGSEKSCVYFHKVCQQTLVIVWVNSNFPCEPWRTEIFP